MLIPDVQVRPLMGPLDRGEGGVGGANENNFPRGPKTYSRWPSRVIFSPHGPNVPIYHVLPISRGPFCFARGPFMARGLLFEKHWLRVLLKVNDLQKLNIKAL